MIRRSRAQDGRPLGNINFRPDRLMARQKCVVADINQPGNLVTAFQMFAQQIEQPRLIPIQGAFGNTKMGLAFLLQPVAQAGKAVHPDIGGLQVQHPAGEDVELHPHLR